MPEFGFSLHKDQQIDHDRTGEDYRAIVQSVPSVATCIACGACNATCVSAEQTGIGFRKLLTYLRNDMKTELVRGLKYCQLCGKCWLVCPRGINTRKAILEMKNHFEVIKT